MITRLDQFKKTIYRMKLHLQELKNRGLEPPISYNPESTISMKPDSKSYYLKIDIKTQPGKRGSGTISLHVLVFKQASPEAWLDFQTMLQKIHKGQSLKTGLQ